MVLSEKGKNERKKGGSGSMINTFRQYREAEEKIEEIEKTLMRYAREALYDGEAK